MPQPREEGRPGGRTGTTEGSPCNRDSRTGYHTDARAARRPGAPEVNHRVPTLRKPGSPSEPSYTPALAVPRAWLTVLTVLAIVPWLVVAAVYWWPAGPAAVVERPAEGRQAAAMSNAGAWGRLDVTTVTISPPIEMIANDWGRESDEGKYWFFPDTTSEVAAAFLASTGMAPNHVSALMATARKAAGINGTVLTPQDDVVLALPPEVRARLYVELAKSALNANQMQAFRYSDESIEAWLGPTLISPATRRFVEPLIYRHGSHLFFADAAVARSRIADAEELRRLAKALLRQKTVRLRLTIGALSEVPGLVDYWGRGGRRTDIKPLLESIVGARGDSSVDIVHLLPAFARERLYRYPLLTAQDLNRPQLANCLWTALNFFNNPPDDRYLDVAAAVEHLQRNYYLVENRLELGDVVALLDERGNIFHAVVYVADNFVFTKNGMSPMSPWVILPLDTVVDYYRLRSEKIRLLYHRRKDL